MPLHENWVQNTNNKSKFNKIIMMPDTRLHTNTKITIRYSL